MPTSSPEGERLVAHEVTEIVWLRLRRLTSRNICRRIVSKRCPELSPELLDKKADGVASAMRSALGYWEAESETLNAKILTRYYALLQISIAEQVASSDPAADLEGIQRHTEQGHGLATLNAPDGAFPANFYIACLKGGHFYAYARHRNLDLSTCAFEKKPRRWEGLSADDRAKLVSLADLFRRIPELQPIVRESLDTTPLSFQVFQSLRNNRERSQRRRDHAKETSQVQPGDPSIGPRRTTYVTICSPDREVTAEYLQSLGLPFTNIHDVLDETSSRRYFEGELSHRSDERRCDNFPHYKSDYCATSVIVPVWSQTVDVFALHLMVMYACSIVVRYLPSLWHRIEEGDLNHIRALLEYYVSIVDNVLPKIAVERVTGARLWVDQAGSWTAPT